jgi:hypothetical protein
VLERHAPDGKWSPDRYSVRKTRDESIGGQREASGGHPPYDPDAPPCFDGRSVSHAARARPYRPTDPDPLRGGLLVSAPPLDSEGLPFTACPACGGGLFWKPADLPPEGPG